MVHFYTCTLVCIIESWMRLGDKPLVSIKKVDRIKFRTEIWVDLSKAKIQPP